MAKKFFYACAGVLCLALAYHFGATSASAQAGSPVTGMAVANLGCGGEVYVMTANGDVYRRSYICGALTGSSGMIGNYWSGAGPTSVKSGTWGEVKARYR